MGELGGERRGMAAGPLGSRRLRGELGRCRDNIFMITALLPLSLSLSTKRPQSAGGGATACLRRRKVALLQIVGLPSSSSAVVRAEKHRFERGAAGHIRC